MCTPVSGLVVRVVNVNGIIPHMQVTVLLAKELTKESQHSCIFCDIETGSLVFIRKIFDDDYQSLFSKYHPQIVKHTKLIIIGKHNDNGFWLILLTSPVPAKIPLTKPSQPTSNGKWNNRSKTHKKNFAQYISGSIFNP